MIEKYGPYKLFFKMGVLYSFIGILIWSIYFFLGLGQYPSLVHPQIMVGSFFFSFVFGFLLTALPNMMGIRFVTRFESMVLATPILLATIANFYDRKFGMAGYLFSLLFFIFFLLKRFQEKDFKLQMPPFFHYIYFGLLLGLLGLAALFFGLGFNGKVLFYRGMLTFLLTGLGSKLLPMIMKNGAGGMCSTFKNSKYEKKKVLIGLLGFGLEAFGFVRTGLALQFIFVYLFAAEIGFKNLNAKTKTSQWASVGIVGLLIGPIGAFIFPSFSIHFHHVTFLMGFTILTLVVASRVIFAHGGHDLFREENSSFYHWMGMGFICAMLFRLMAGASMFYHPNLFLALITISSLFFLFSMLVWMRNVLIRIF